MTQQRESKIKIKLLIQFLEGRKSFLVSLNITELDKCTTTIPPHVN